MKSHLSRPEAKDTVASHEICFYAGAAPLVSRPRRYRHTMPPSSEPPPKALAAGGSGRPGPLHSGISYVTIPAVLWGDRKLIKIARPAIFYRLIACLLPFGLLRRLALDLFQRFRRRLSDRLVRAT